MGDGPSNGRVDIGDLSQDISFMTRTIRARMRPEVNALRQKIGVAPGEIGILRIIGTNPGISQNDLAAAVVIKKSAATKVIHDLVADGLVAREQVQRDRRYNALTLTAKGEALVKQVTEQVDALYDNWLNVFTNDERAQLFALLGRLADRLAEGQDGTDRLGDD